MTLKRSTLTVAVAVAVTLVMVMFNIVGFSYRHVYDNHPLTHPRKVIRMNSEELVMADGTHYDFIPAPDWDPNTSDALLESSAYEVEIRPLGNDKRGAVVLKRATFICGTFDPLITIPLIRVDVPRYHTVTTGTVTVIGDTDGQPSPPPYSSPAAGSESGEA
jgi:hypothetical protein